MPMTPNQLFHLPRYLRINESRLKHLGSLGLDLSHKKVLEVGAGIGDLTYFFLARGCSVVCTEARKENLAILKAAHPDVEAYLMDLNDPIAILEGRTFDVIFCYGLLYHLHAPAKALKYLASLCEKFMILESCVSYGTNNTLNECSEDETDFTQSVSGKGCKPTRGWIYEELKCHFEYVYVCKTQPDHEEFPISWSQEESSTESTLTRCVFIASKQELDNSLLAEELLITQTRYIR